MIMKQKQVDDNISIIYIPELHFLNPEESEKCIKLINCFTNGNECLFGLYREDGNFEDHNDVLIYRSKIPEYYKKNGKFADLTLDEFKNQKKFDRRISAIGSLPLNEETYKMIPIICNYYLETMFFESKKSWEDFKTMYRSKNMQCVSDLINNGYTDFVFLNIDSGTFCVEFNTKKYNSDTVMKKIKSIIGN